MDRACVVYESIDQVPLNHWDEVCQSEDNCFMSPNFLRAIERTQTGEARSFHVLIYEEDGRPAACASLSLFPLDLLLLAGAQFKSRVSWLRRLLPSFGQVKMLMCGQPFSAGQRHLAFAPGADRARAVRLLDELLEELAKREGARLIVFKEFGAADRAELNQLEQLHYWRADSPPMYELGKPFDDFDAYRATLKSDYRANVRRAEKRFEKAGCKFACLDDPAEIAEVYTPEAHALYEAVVEKSELKLEVLSREFFLELARQLPGRLRLTVAYRQERMIGFAWHLTSGDAFHGLFLGIDYSQVAETDLYFNLVYQSFDVAFRAGAKVVHLGQTADRFKSLLGCNGKPLCFYARGIGASVAWILRQCARWLFPTRDALPAHDVFKADIAVKPKPLKAAA
jgi:predicted N-acyltransferase